MKKTIVLYFLIIFSNRKSIEIGRTDFTKVEIEHLIILLGKEYRGIDYHLMNNNCNDFSKKFCKVNKLFIFIIYIYIYSLSNKIIFRPYVVEIYLLG